LQAACLADGQEPLDESVAGVGLGSVAGASPVHDERDTMRELRRSSPAEVVVTAAAHPLAGRTLAVAGHRVVGGVACLIVRLPDGSPGTVALSATSAGGDGPPRGGTGAVLSVERVRWLRAQLQRRLADGDGT
jgi:hypothetical protein